MSHIKIDLPFPLKSKIIALGPQSKSSFCIVDKDVAYLSEANGDLNDLENFKLFERRLRRLKKKLRIKPELIACDLHPEYISTKFANDLVKLDKGLRVKKVQHHEAHVASCIVDNNIKGDVIGVAFDGTGFGLDENIWGGEFFIGAVKRGFERVAHLQYIPMPGGDAAVREPWRMGLSYLYSVYDAGFRDLKIDFLTGLDKKVAEILIQVINKKINSPLTSSIGRLFDAVSSILGICEEAQYEGQAAVELEKAIRVVHSSRFTVDSYKFGIDIKRTPFVIVPDKVVKGIVEDLKNRVPKGVISLKFHNAVCRMIKDVCVLLKERYKISRVCLSGGVFQNRYLTNHTKPLLEKEGFGVYFHKNFPTHDGSIALGQAVIADSV
ncbi:MAG: hypothetical protein KJ952_02200 [Candidatus Omnitrophica bacterium]|nr:hypothetical protein [Candidatus Omnitrophota bacterium]